MTQRMLLMVFHFHHECGINILYMNIGKGHSKIPHSLRIVILLLRLVIGLNFFYAVAYDKLHTPQQWAFFVIGALIIVGLLTRLTSILAIILIAINFWPSVNFPNINVAHFVNEQVILITCLLVLIFSNAGKYIGLDTFIHIKTGKSKE